MQSGIKKYLTHVSRAVYCIIMNMAKFILASIVLIISAQVLSRNVFKINIRWNQEVALVFTIWLAFLGIAIGSKKDLHISVGIIFDTLPSKVKFVLNCIISLLTLLVGVFFLLFGTRLTISTSQSILPITGWPASMKYIIIPISGFCLILFSILDLMDWKKFIDVPKNANITMEDN